jgi:hypothetical protein
MGITALEIFIPAKRRTEDASPFPDSGDNSALNIDEIVTFLDCCKQPIKPAKILANRMTVRIGT